MGIQLVKSGVPIQQAFAAATSAVDDPQDQAAIIASMKSNLPPDTATKPAPVPGAIASEREKRGEAETARADAAKVAAQASLKRAEAAIQRLNNSISSRPSLEDSETRNAISWIKQIESELGKNRRLIEENYLTPETNPGIFADQDRLQKELETLKTQVATKSRSGASGGSSMFPPDFFSSLTSGGGSTTTTPPAAGTSSTPPGTVSKTIVLPAQ